MHSLFLDVQRCRVTKIRTTKNVGYLKGLK